MVPADIVVSLAGHDRGNAFVLLQTDGCTALVADGKNRKLSKPKSKNQSHLTLGRPGSAEMQRAIESGSLTDREIRRTLAVFRSEAAMTEEGKSVCQKMM